MDSGSFLKASRAYAWPFRASKGCLEAAPASERQQKVLLRRSESFRRVLHKRFYPGPPTMAWITTRGRSSHITSTHSKAAHHLHASPGTASASVTRRCPSALPVVAHRAAGHAPQGHQRRSPRGGPGRPPGGGGRTWREHMADRCYDLHAAVARATGLRSSDLGRRVELPPACRGRHPAAQLAWPAPGPRPCAPAELAPGA